MKLLSVTIKNFRSIEEIEIDFEPSCRVLVGINESGKTNILRALSMIGEGYSPTGEDIREPLQSEKSVTSAYIQYDFALDKNEMGSIYTIVKAKLLSKKIDEPILFSGDKGLSLNSFCLSRNAGLYNVDLLTQKKSTKYWMLGQKYTIPKKWKKPSTTCPADYTIEVDGKSVPLKNYLIINTDDFPEIPNTHITEIFPENINELIGPEVTKIIKESLPKVIFWKYDEKNLLPPSINIDSFVANPESVEPLKNMFTLAGITDIAKEINEARKIPGNKLRNLLHRVAEHSTKHFRDVWKEYKEISFSLEPNGADIDAGIKEKNHWKMSQRSDGIKRFITFLLHISANVKSNLINGALLLIDEPDMGLHPSGSRYLRDELIETSKKNYVVFSTHSIFMIDKDSVPRHIIVQKDEEKTTTENASKSNLVDEEVLYNALNFSVYDILKNDNLIFEGWRDKRLFQVATSKIPAPYSERLKILKEKMKTMGLCHTEGVKDIRNVTPIIEMSGRNCTIISDGDDPSKEKQSEYEKMKGYGVWKRYDEMSSSATVETSEDFIKQGVFLTAITKAKTQYPTLTGNPNISGVGKIKSTKDWLSSEGMTGAQSKEFLNVLKNIIFDNLKPADIDNTYYDFLTDLSDFLWS